MVRVFLLLIVVWCSSCTGDPYISAPPDSSVASRQVHVTGAMRNVMWKGQLGPSIALDSLRDRPGLCAVGPLTGLQGEITCLHGSCFVSRVSASGDMIVEHTFDAAAPFLVYAQVTAWDTVTLPTIYRGIAGLQAFVDSLTQDAERPFALQLSGRVASARIHIQNHPDGATISSPTEAHAGQVKYHLLDEEVDVVGFFSTEHQGVFTHHDTYLHLHLITRDRRSMGHLEGVEWGDIQVYLPKE